MSFELNITADAKADILKHKKAGDNAILKKLFILLNELRETPFTGTGKPEPLKHNLTGFWSRRINREHRLVYEVFENTVAVHSAYGHYE
jgi:toxin YoeB